MKKYGIIHEEVLASTELSNTSKLVYSYLSTMADKEGVCYPSQRYIADKLGVTAKTVQRGIKQLSETGFIQVVKQKASSNMGAFLSNKYVLVHRRDMKLEPEDTSVRRTSVSPPGDTSVQGGDTSVRGVDIGVPSIGHQSPLPEDTSVPLTIPINNTINSKGPPEVKIVQQEPKPTRTKFEDELDLKRRGAESQRVLKMADKLGILGKVDKQVRSNLMDTLEHHSPERVMSALLYATSSTDIDKSHVALRFFVDPETREDYMLYSRGPNARTELSDTDEGKSQGLG